MTESTFRSLPELTHAVRDFLRSHEGALVLEILSSAASINPNKRLPAGADAQLLTLAEYNRLLGHQEALSILKGLAEYSKPLPKESDFKPLGETSEEDLPPAYVVPVTQTK